MEQNDMLVIAVAITVLLIAYVIWCLDNVQGKYLIVGATPIAYVEIKKVKGTDGTSTMMLYSDKTGSAGVKLVSSGWNSWSLGSTAVLTVNVLSGELSLHEGTQMIALVKQ